MTDFLGRAPALVVTTDVTGWSQNRVERLMAAILPITSEGEWTSESVHGEVWTPELAERAMDMLAESSSSAQIKVLRYAMQHGGTVTRDEVYEICGYDSSRSLKGFTRPVNRVTLILRDSGHLPEEAANLLEPIFDPNLTGYQRALGFRVPPELAAGQSSRGRLRNI